jgi:dihydropteroate synthase
MSKQKLVNKEETTRAIPLANGRRIPLDRPLVMGILNLTPDSFSDGGLHPDRNTAIDHAVRMAAEGADIIDIGGESTRPGAEPVSEIEELERVLPVLKAVRYEIDFPISVDTYKANVARAALDEGADIINDVSALRFDQQMPALVAERNVPVILMHMLGAPQDMQKNPHYDDCVAEIAQFLSERLAFATEHGIDRTKIIIDPGIGFGKRLVDNLDILRNLAAFKSLGAPLLVGASRKGFIGMLNPGSRSASERIGGSIAAAVTAVINGADIIRVHDVAPTVEALKVIQAIRKGI